MPSYTLYYFNSRGRAEICRMLFAAAGVHYNDKRIDYSEWSNFRGKMSGSVLPVLEIDGKTQIPQSMAIARYLAREFGFHGRNNLEMARIDFISDCFYEIVDDYLRLFHDKEGRIMYDQMSDMRNRYIDMDGRMTFGTVGGYAVQSRGDGGYYVKSRGDGGYPVQGRGDTGYSSQTRSDDACLGQGRGEVDTGMSYDASTGACTDINRGDMSSDINCGLYSGGRMDDPCHTSESRRMDDPCGTDESRRLDVPCHSDDHYRSDNPCTDDSCQAEDRRGGHSDSHRIDISSEESASRRSRNHAFAEGRMSEMRLRYMETCRRVLPFMERTLEMQHGGDTFFCGDEMMLCDMMCYCALENPLMENASFFGQYPKLMALRERVASQINISQYIKRRYQSDF